jgi:hypothetical protein
MQKLLPSALSSLAFLVLFSSPPVAAFVDGEPGLARHSETSLDHCQKQYTERLRFRDTEEEYQAEKVRYTEAVGRKCQGEKWYNLGLLECALFVPIFGLFLPFSGALLIDTLRSTNR